MAAPRVTGQLARQRLHVHRRPRVGLSRRRALGLGLSLLASGAGLAFGLIREHSAHARPINLVRPPTASHDDEEFQRKCTRCGLCGTVCENGCIRFAGMDESTIGAGTPYLDVRRRSCTLCMRCTQICPTGALAPVAAELPEIVERVDMGKAQVERDLCISYQGRLCGYCHDACPLPGIAIKLIPPALPVILPDCVGCGRCVELCPQTPGALSIVRDTP